MRVSGYFEEFRFYVIKSGIEAFEKICQMKVGRHYFDLGSIRVRREGEKN